jgi:zinc and cadmium transporter
MSFTYMNLIGDAVHNFLDGVILAGAFLLGAHLGIVTAVAVFLHEVPQEIGDFGVLLKGGFSRKKALAANFLVALTAFLGAGAALAFDAVVGGMEPYLIAVAIGGFIYIAGTDLLPVLGKCVPPKQSMVQLFFILLGVGAMFLILLLE